MRNRVFTVLNLIFVPLFAVFSWFQINDTDKAIYENASLFDAWSWVVFYGLIAVSFGLAVAKIRPWPLYLLMIGFCVYELIDTGPGLYRNLFGDEEFTMMQNSMSAEDPRVELSREFFGAVIALVAIGFLWLQRRFTSKEDPKPSQPQPAD
ncbi:MAG: hypothetical protein ACI8UO_000957 [Verrucomicrobiales bacterium]|jgi:hypothetical protein